MKLNFILSQSGATLPLTFSRSSNAKGIEIPYVMDVYTPLINYLNNYIPQEWLDTMNDLKQQERDIIAKRKQLMLEYREQIAIIAPSLIELFHADHPEYFI